MLRRGAAPGPQPPLGAAGPAAGTEGGGRHREGPREERGHREGPAPRRKAKVKPAGPGRARRAPPRGGARRRRPWRPRGAARRPGPQSRGFSWRGPCLKKKGIGRQSSCWSSTCFRVLTPFLSRISQRKPIARYGRVSRRTPARLRLEAPQEATSFSHPSTATQSRVGCPAPCSGDFWRSPKRRLLHLSGQPVPGHH